MTNNTITRDKYVTLHPSKDNYVPEGFNSHMIVMIFTQYENRVPKIGKFLLGPKNRIEGFQEIHPEYERLKYEVVAGPNNGVRFIPVTSIYKWCIIGDIEVSAKEYAYMATTLMTATLPSYGRDNIVEVTGCTLQHDKTLIRKNDLLRIVSAESTYKGHMFGVSALGINVVVHFRQIDSRIDFPHNEFRIHFTIHPKYGQGETNNTFDSLQFKQYDIK